MAPRPDTGISLRPYQEQAIAAILNALERGVMKQLVVMPTGSGKTIVFSELIRRLGQKALILTHRDELIQQAIDKLHMVDPDLDIGIVKADENNVDAHVVVASVQTLARERRLSQLPRDFGVAIIDEAHHSPAESYRRILDHVRDEKTITPPLVVGVTATADRADGQGLGATFDEVVFELLLLDLIEQGYLVDIVAKTIRYRANTSALRVVAGDISEASAARVFRQGGGPAAVAKALTTLADTRKSLVFVPGVESAHETAATINQSGLCAAAIDGTTPLLRRREILGRFRDGHLQAIVNCGVLTEGFDEPSISCVVLARPTLSRGLFSQMAGRGLRPHPGKEDVLLLDLAGNTTRHPLVSAASLVGLAPEDLREGEFLTQAIARKRRLAVRIAHAQHVEVDLHVRTVDLFRQRTVHWVQAGDHFTASTGHSMVTLRPDDLAADRWTAIERLPDGTTHVLAGGISLAYAQGVAEDHVRRVGSSVLVDPNAAWRRGDTPATAKQLATLRKFRITPPPNLTKGGASDLITRAIAGMGAS